MPNPKQEEENIRTQLKLFLAGVEKIIKNPGIFKLISELFNQKLTEKYKEDSKLQDANTSPAKIKPVNFEGEATPSTTKKPPGKTS